MSSDSASSEVTYTSISSHGDPLAWVVDFFRLQEPEAAPESPDYVPGPEEPEQGPLSPDYDQPYAIADLPIALSPGYVADLDLEEDPEENSEDGPVDYPADGGDNDDDDSSDDDEEEEEASEEEEVFGACGNLLNLGLSGEDNSAIMPINQPASPIGLQAMKCLVTMSEVLGDHIWLASMATWSS
ncbi:hypothetical protein Tco_1313620 [Tanacetum coccineum]